MIFLFLALMVFGCSLPKDNLAGTATEAGNPEIADGSSSSQVSVSSSVSSSLMFSSSIVSSSSSMLSSSIVSSSSSVLSSSLSSSSNESSSSMSSSSETVPVNLATIEGVLLTEAGDPAAFMPFEFRLDSILPQDNILLIKHAVGGILVNDTTDAEGRYRIESILPGKYIIQTSPDSLSSGVRIPVAVSEYENRVVEPTQIQKVGTVKFQIETSENITCTVKIKFNGVSKEYVVDHSGTETELLIPVPPGEYEAIAYITGYTYPTELTETSTVTVTSEQESEWEIHL